ncbi:hypothetical protein ACIQ8D_33585 [Streptomyces sp. NPDC096094]|uniref:hypothetical protein n=1 Tax=Streptomyces sp. NPDC096094 TaxID=3366073 RepID=UPI00381315A2
MPDVRPSQRMRNLGVVQRGTGVPGEMARSFSLPAERDEAERITDELRLSTAAAQQIKALAAHGYTPALVLEPGVSGIRHADGLSGGQPDAPTVGRTR